MASDSTTTRQWEIPKKAWVLWSGSSRTQRAPKAKRSPVVVNKLFGWIHKDTRTETLLTTERELSLQKENVQLLGLDHPLVAAYLRKFRELPPEELGLCVQSPDGTEGGFGLVGS